MYKGLFAIMVRLKLFLVMVSILKLGAKGRGEGILECLGVVVDEGCWQ